MILHLLHEKRQEREAALLKETQEEAKVMADLAIEQAGIHGYTTPLSSFSSHPRFTMVYCILLPFLNLFHQLCKQRNFTRSWRRTWPRSEKVGTLYGRVHRFASHLIKLIEAGFVVVLGIIAFATFPDGCSPLLGLAIVVALAVRFLTQGVDATSLCMRGILWCCT